MRSIHSLSRVSQTRFFKEHSLAASTGKLLFTAPLLRARLSLLMLRVKRLTLFPLTACLLLSISHAADAQTAAPTGSPAIEQNEAGFDPAAATRAWLATMPINQRQKSDAYFESGYWLILWNFLLAAAISI